MLPPRSHPAHTLSYMLLRDERINTNIDYQMYALQTRAGEHYDAVWDSPGAVGGLVFTIGISAGMR